MLIVENLVQKQTLDCALFFQKVQASIIFPRGYLQEDTWQIHRHALPDTLQFYHFRLDLDRINSLFYGSHYLST